jgi:hypothetical protein
VEKYAQSHLNLEVFLIAILRQTEPDDNVKDSTLKLALKHPTQTTIVQMQKDGTYRVVYGTKLDKITGSGVFGRCGVGFRLGVEEYAQSHLSLEVFLIAILWIYYFLLLPALQC